MKHSGKNASHYLSDIFFNRLEALSKPMRISYIFIFCHLRDNSVYIQFQPTSIGWHFPSRQPVIFRSPWLVLLPLVTPRRLWFKKTNMLWGFMTAVEPLPHLSAACHRLNILGKLLTAKWPVGFRTVCYISGTVGQKKSKWGKCKGWLIVQIRILIGLEELAGSFFLLGWNNS